MPSRVVPRLLVTLLLLGLPLLAAAAPGELDIPRLLEESRAARANEAALKQRGAEARLLADFQRTPNQEQFDVQSYDLSVNLNPTTHVLTGTNLIVAQVTAGPVSTMELDLTSPMVVTGATAAGGATTWTHVSSLVTVTLDRSYATGELVTVGVSYQGNPSGEYFGWDSHAGQTLIWTLSEPFGARDWWPCKDDNSDKAEVMDIRVTVPTALIVASNGLETSDTDNGNGTHTSHWHTDYAMAPYLASVTAYPYTVFTDSYPTQGGGDPMLVQFFVYPDHYAQVQENYGKVVGMLDTYSQAFGEYPFVNEKYGHAEFNWGGGMEHQTCTSLGGDWESVIAHELGHQWWGDMITCADFGHIWLNEGFASWMEAYYYGSIGGMDAYRQYMDGMAYYGGGTVFVENPFTDNIFDGNLSYDKGAWVVHMLRGALGETDFFAGLAAYRAQYGYGSATTEQLRDVLEGVSGMDLDAFFQEWIYGDYFPVYRLSYAPAGDGVDVTIEQLQTNTGLFTMPIQLRVVTDQGTTDFTVQNSLATENYHLTVAGALESVALDPDHWILRQVQTTVNNPSFANGILLVNGVDWDTYAPEIQNACEAQAFWGDNPIDFWDNFPAPTGGYPSTLPAPLGHGSVPAEVIGAYSTVIWVGNNFNGDLPKWQETPILSYLEVGGNVLLMSRMGVDFLDGALADYLGVNFVDSGSPGNYLSVYPGLTDIGLTGTQSFCDVFSTAVGPGSTLLYQTTSGFGTTRGLGVHAQQPGGGSFRPEGAQFVYLAGRPYRMNFTALRTNVETILDQFFGEPWTATSAPGDTPAAFALAGNYPNPFNPKTEIRFTLAAAGAATLRVFDTQGRLVRTLVDGPLAAGEQRVVWDGADGDGHRAASGVYFYRLEAEGRSATRRMVLLK